jgi:methionyl-tRNA synthetase
LTGNLVVFVSGSDEHGTPLEVEALKRGIPVKALADENHARIIDLFEKWHISYDNYTRTESQVHKEYVRGLYSEIYANDSYIFTKVEIIHYCPRDKRFLPDRFVEGTCPFCAFESARGDQCDNCGRPLDAEKLLNAHCVICGNITELRDTKQWFFDLPKLSEYVSGYLDRAELSQNVIRFCRGWLKEGLRARSITRDSEWGIKAPFPGAESKTIYVWMEAVLGYPSATLEYFKNRGTLEEWDKYWMNPGAKTSFFIGKDNIPFHAIILPSLLHASGKKYNEPSLISSTEFLLFEGQKFSKSRRIGIWIDEALEVLPVDYWRYALVALRPESGDINFGWDSLCEKINNDLNDTIGNFVNRTLVGVSRFADNNFGITHDTIAKEFQDNVAVIKSRHKYVRNLYERTELQAACRAVLDNLAKANAFLSATEPWKVIKEDKNRAQQILYVALTNLKISCSELSPIIPSSVVAIVHQSGLYKKSSGVPNWDDESIDNDLPIKVRDVKPIFQKQSSEDLRLKLEALRNERHENKK